MNRMFTRICVRFLAFAAGLCVLYSISGWSQSAEPGDIHGVDFRNFRYHPACMNEVESRKAAVKTVNGSYTKQDPDGKAETFMGI